MILSRNKTSANLSKTLEELEDSQWPPSELNSHVATECRRLRNVPLQDLTTEDLRLMIGQQFSLPVLMPLALDTLNANPMAEGALYRGDLLVAVLSVSDNYWQAHSEEFDEVVEVRTEVEIMFDTLKEDVAPLLEKFSHR